MHKLLSNSVNKLKYLNFKNLITENTVRNGVNYHGFEAASVSYSTKQNRQSTNLVSINNNVADVSFCFIFRPHQFNDKF